MTILTKTDKSYIKTRDRKAKKCLKCGKVITYGTRNKSGYCHSCSTRLATQKTNLSRKIKKVLFISDDFDDDNFETLKYLIRSQNSEKNSIKFKIYLTENFEKIPKVKFDVALVDYGLIGNYQNPHETSIKILKELHDKGIILIWCGGLAEHSNGDAKALFPSKYFMHNLNSCGVGYGSIIEVLYIELEKLKEKNGKV